MISTRETIYNVASKYGLRATFAPRLYSTSCTSTFSLTISSLTSHTGGSGAHTHISVHKTGSYATPTRADDPLAPTMTQAERSFLQGVLEHAPALCAFTLPTKFSYARVMDGIWSGGTYASWGTDQREATVRLCGAEGQHHFEVRFIDGTATPYLVLASILGVGTEAVIANALLKSGDCGTPVALMSEDERKALGVENTGSTLR